MVGLNNERKKRKEKKKGGGGETGKKDGLNLPAVLIQTTTRPKELHFRESNAIYGSFGRI